MKSALLAISDSATKLRLLRILGRHGWWVDTAPNVEGALAFLDEGLRDVALIDWDIGDGSGLALLRAVKTHPFWGSVPVIMLHDRVELREVERAFALGANEFLPKPFTDAGALRIFERWVIDRPGSTGWKLAG